MVASTRHLGCPAKQIHFLPVRSGQHLDQHLVRRVTSQCIPGLEDGFVDRVEARFELRHGFRSERRFLLIEQILENGDIPQIRVFLDRESGK